MNDSKPVADATRAPSAVDFRRVVHLASDAIAIHDGERIVYANAAAAALTGATDAEALVGRPVFGFVAPDHLAAVQARVRELMARGLPLPRAEQVFLRLDGTRVEVETTGAPLGEGLYMVVVRDVSRRVRAERAQRSAESRLRAFFEVSSEAFGISEASTGRVVATNEAHARLFGHGDPGRSAGRSFFERIAPAERARVADAGRRLASGEIGALDLSTRGLRADGTEFDLDVRVVAFDDGADRLLAATLRDVTAARAQERRLLEGERRFRELFELMPVSLWEEDASGLRAIVDGLRASGVTDLGAHLDAHPEVVAACAAAMRVVDVNSTAWEALGAASKEDLLGGLERVFVPESLPAFRALVLQLAAGRAVVHAEGWNATLGGERRWVQLTGRVLPGHEEDWRRLLVSTVDATDRHRADEERAALAERLRQAEKLEAVGRLAGGVAHDFNNVLSGILGYAELTILDLPPESELREHQARIREAALRARDLVRQILTFSRRDRAQARPVDVPMIVREALGLLRAGIPSTAAFEARIDPEAGAVLADPTQLHQIVLNLCANARDAIGPYGRIEVAVERVDLAAPAAGVPAGAWVRLRVRDDGVGMDDATRARLFEPFMTTKGRFGGHGLGLAVVHGIVAAAGGAVVVESAPGRGSTFDVYLPRRDLAAAPPPPPARHPAGRGERILLVDDEPMVLDAHRRLLESLGYVVEGAADGEQALARFRERPGAFDVVLTDQTMPRLSGVDLARAILDLRPAARVVVCTGYSERVDDETARGLGLRALLTKPVDRETLASTLRRVLSERDVLQG